MAADEATAIRHPSGRSINDVPRDILDAIAAAADERCRPSIRLTCKKLRDASDRVSPRARVRIPRAAGERPFRMPGAGSLTLCFRSEDVEGHLPETLGCFPATRKLVIIAWEDWLTGVKVRCISRFLKKVRTLKIVGRILPCAVSSVPASVEELDARLAVTTGRSTWMFFDKLTALRSLRLPVDGSPHLSGIVRNMSGLTTLVGAPSRGHALEPLPPRLVSLRLAHGHVSSLGPLLALRGVRHLDLSQTSGVGDYSPLSSLRTLTSLCLSRCKVTPREASVILSGLRGLRHLDMEMNDLAGWDDPPAFPPGLETVYLSYSPLPRRVARRIAELKALRAVEAYRSGLLEEDFRPLGAPIVRTSK